jgi:hypothetical protein
MTEEYLDEGQSDDQGEDQDASDQQIQFNLSISTDRDHFLRRTCPSCGRDFKTEIDPADLEWALISQIRRVSREIGEEPAEMAGKATQDNLRCPYCQDVAEASEMHTEETIDYLKRFAYRDYAVPKLNEMFSDLEDSIGRGGSSGGGGFLSISISFKHEPIPKPPRPIHGPEPADMKIVEFLCCGKKIKVSDRWMGVTACTFCGTEVALI